MNLKYFATVTIGTIKDQKILMHMIEVAGTGSTLKASCAKEARNTEESILVTNHKQERHHNGYNKERSGRYYPRGLLLGL